MKKLLLILTVLLSFSCAAMAQSTSQPQPGAGTGSGGTFILNIQANPSNAIIYVDGKRVQSGGIRVSAGTHTISAEAPGYADYSATVNVRQNMNFTVDMKPVSSGGTGTYTLSFVTNPPNAAVYVDGRRVSGNSIQVSRGSHTISAQAAGYDNFSATLNVLQNITFPINMKASSSGISVYTLGIQVSPSNALVYVDGNRVSGNSIRVSPGAHTITAQAAGYLDYSATVNVRQDMSFTVEMKAAAAALYTLTIQISPANAIVYIDGNRLAGNSIRLAAGAHTVKAEAAGYSDYSASINLSQNMSLPVNLTALNYKLTVSCNVSSAAIYVDGLRIQGNAVNVGAGTHTVRVEAAGYTDYLTQVNVTGNMTLPISLAMSQVQLTVNTPNLRGAQVMIDGKAAGVSPLVTQLPPGVYTVSVQAPGYTTYTERVVLNNSPLTINAVLQPGQLSTVTCILPAGSLVNKPGNAQNRVDIYVDDIAQASNVFPVRPGTHVIRIESGIFSLEQTIEFEAGRSYIIQPGLLVSIQQ